MRRLTFYTGNIYKGFLAGKSDNQDVRRYEFVLNILLCGLTLASLFAGLVDIVDHDADGMAYHDNTLLGAGLLLVTAMGLWGLSRAGKYLYAAYIFLGCISFVALEFTLRWSFELPTAELSWALLIVIAGVILETRAALRLTCLTVASILALGYSQVVSLLHTDTAWLHESLVLSNIIDYALLLSVIGLVSWLANSEIERLLRSTLATKTALAKERDSLETKVAERTQQLEQSQLQHLLELQRFADFGRVSAHLLHEVANPLTAAFLNLEESDHQQSEAIQRARKNLHQLERYLSAARKQLQSEGQFTEFNVKKELAQLLTVLLPLAQKAGVALVIKQRGTGTLLGDPVKFNQIIANLVVNAIDAYSSTGRQNNDKQVSVLLTLTNDQLLIKVRDRGKGITSEQLPKIFEPFYSTKLAGNRGLGIGLAMIKHTIETDFHGNITVDSSPEYGTVFTVSLAARQNPECTVAAKRSKAIIG